MLAIYEMNRKWKFIYLTVFLCLLVGLARVEYVKAEAIDTLYNDEVFLVRGELENLTVHSITRLSVTDPDIADVVDATATDLLIVGKEVGQTILFVWDEHGKRSIMIHVFNNNLDLVKERLTKLFKSADISGLTLEANEHEGKVVISGEYSQKVKQQYEKLILPFDDDIISLAKEEKNENLVQIDLQITELNTTLSKALGIDWITGGSSGSGTGAVSGGGAFSPTYTERLPEFDGSIGDFFKIGDFQRTAILQANVQALLEEGKGRVLSQPKLVVVSGEEASFLVGGEIPIRTTTQSQGATQENVQFKQYGISMTLTPTVRIDAKIDVQMSVEVSDIDAANAVGSDVAFITREADTRLLLDDGQTIVMAGLIKQNESELVKKVPFFSEIPIVGLIFRSKATPTANQDTELVITMTPHVLEQKQSEIAKAESNKEDSKGTQQGTIERYASQAKPYYSGIPREMTDYVRSVQERISQSIEYPPEALQHGWQGTVKVGMLILRDGTLAFALVKESSGYDLFDDQALEIAKNNAPYSQFPSGTDLQELNVTIPIVYSLNRN